MRWSVLKNGNPQIDFLHKPFTIQDLVKKGDRKVVEMSNDLLQIKIVPPRENLLSCIEDIVFFDPG